MRATACGCTVRAVRLALTFTCATVAIFARSAYRQGVGDIEKIMRDRVRQVLRRSGMTDAQFAKQIDLDPTKLSKSLAGTRRFTSFELASIAAVGNTTVDWLLGGEDAAVAMATRLQEGAEPVIGSALDRARSYAEVDATLRRLVGATPLSVLPPPPSSGLAIEAGPELAERALAVITDVGRLDDLREDPAQVIEDAFGVNVAFEAFDEGLDGMAFATEGFRLVMVNSRISWSRQRFTLAHECAHILSRDGADPEGARIDRDVMNTGTGQRRIAEVRANAFAAAFLMPKADVGARFRDGVTEEGFACAVGRYRVSPSALAWRLVNLGLLRKAEAKPFQVMSSLQAARLGGWVPEFDELTLRQSRPRPPFALSMRAAQAFIEGTISARPLAAVLNVPAETLLSPPCVDLAAQEPVFAP